LVCSEVVDVEDELFWEELGISPNGPTNTWVNETIFVAGDVDGDNVRKLKVPFELRSNERSNEPS
jgi:hypothetical protein